MTSNKAYLFLLFALLIRLSCCIDIITTIAGSSTSGSYSGDNGQATSATLYGPYGVDVDTAGK